MGKQHRPWRPVTVDVIYGTTVGGKEIDAKWQKVRGFATTAAPGLAITPSISGGEPDDTWWTVTHRQSGRSIPGLYGDKEAIRRTALRVAELGNFDRPVEELKADKELLARFYEWRREHWNEEEDACA